MKLHLASGTCYLKDWINIDLELPGHHLAKDRPDLVEQNITTLDNYYKTNVTKDDFLKGKFQKKEVVCDEYADVRILSGYEPNTVDEILGVQMFEHFTYEEGNALLNMWYYLLKDGGQLRLHVPDLEGIMREWYVNKHYDAIDERSPEDDIDWTLRQIYGSQKNDWGLHKAGYTREMLTRKMKQAGFKEVKEVENLNSYAAFGLVGIK